MAKTPRAALKYFCCTYRGGQSNGIGGGSADGGAINQVLGMIEWLVDEVRKPSESVRKIQETPAHL